MKIRALNVFVLLFVQIVTGECQPLKTSVLFDSLHSLLNYFYDIAPDTNVKQVIKTAQFACTTYKLNDSSAEKLLTAQKIVMQVNEDSGYMNMQPFQSNIVMEYSEKLCRLFQYCSPAGENIQYAAALHKLGLLSLYHPKYYQQGKECFRKAFEIREKSLPHTHPDYLNSLFFLCWPFAINNEYDKAIPCVVNAISLREAAGIKDRDYANQLSFLGDYYNAIHDFKNAKACKDKLLLVWQEILGADHPLYALHLCYQGLIYEEFSFYEQALDFYQQAMQLTETKLGRENHQYIWCLNGVGGAYWRLGNYEKASAYYREALRINGEAFGEKSRNTPLLLNEYASTFTKTGNFSEALPLLQRALKTEELITSKDSWTLTFYLSNLASLYENLGQYDNAYNALRRGISNITNHHGDQNRECASAYNNLAGFFSRTGNMDSSIFYCKKALQIQKNVVGDRHYGYLATLNQLANLYIIAGMADSARHTLNELQTTALQVFGDSHPEYAKSTYSYAAFYMHEKKYDSARIFYERSAMLRKKIFGEGHPDYIQSLTGLSLANMASKNYTAATGLLVTANDLRLQYIRQTYTSLSEYEKIRFLDQQYEQFHYLPSILLKTGTSPPGVLEQVYNNELVLKGMTLNDQQKILNTIRRSEDTVALQLFNEWLVNKIITGKEMMRPGAERLPTFDSLCEATNELERQLSRLSASFRNQRQSEYVTVQKITGRLKTHEAAIDFTRFHVYDEKFTDSVMYAAILLRAGDSIPEFIPLFEEKQLAGLLNYTYSEKAINRFYAATDDKKNRLPVSGDSLYALIWKPFEGKLSGITTIYHAPAGLLHRIALQALPCDTSGQRLIDKHNLVQVMSTGSVALPRVITPTRSTVAIWGEIQYTGQSNHSNAFGGRGPEGGNSANDTTVSGVNTWPALPGTKMETDSIKNIFLHAGVIPVVITGANATEKNFKALDGKSPQILHIATHGLFRPAKGKFMDNNFAMQQEAMLRSGLVLAGSGRSEKNTKNVSEADEDGILTAYEIAHMDLSNTELVVLSACETALGELKGNEGVIGLQRAFKIAGVKQMVLSLWKVPDRETVELMTFFYKNLMGGQSPSVSLRGAQLKMKEKHPPYYWAGFVLVE